MQKNLSVLYLKLLKKRKTKNANLFLLFKNPMYHSLMYIKSNKKLR